MATQKASRIGGSFAPPLSDKALKEYEGLIEELDDNTALKHALTELHKCCGHWWKLPAPKEEKARKSTPHLSGMGTIIPLHDEHAEALDEHIPWDHELEAYQKMFDEIDPVAQKDLRNAAFHMLWHVKELALGREPMTNDKL
jgi:hypothetical protein